MKKTRAFVMGHPIAHSRSPMLHTYWLERYGIEGSYELIDMPPEGLKQFFDTYRENTQGKYWFPTYIRADDEMTKNNVSIPIRLVIRSTDLHLGKPALPKPASR